MTIEVNINGSITTITSSPGGGVIDIPSASLPGCSTPIIYAAGCPGEQNTYDDWVYYDFPGLPPSVPLSFTIISGNTVFTTDGCGMYPLTINFTIPSSANINLEDQNICDNNVTDAIVLNNNASWTNSNPSIGLPASGSGTIPSFTPIGLPGTIATINFITTCASGSFNYTITPPLSSTFISSDYNGNNISCNGSNDGNIDLSTLGGHPPYSYVWNNGDVSEDLSNLNAGVYSVIITDTNECSTSETIILNEPSPLLVIDSLSDYNGYNISCNSYSNGAINLNVSGSVPGYTYLWNNGSISEDLTGISAGIYSIDITDSNLCVISTVFNLFEPSIIEVIPTLSEINGYNICNGSQDGFIQLVINGSVPSYNVQWSNGATTQYLDSLVAGTFYYSVTDQNGCITSDTIEINEPILNIQENITNVSCYSGATGSASVVVSGSTTPYYIFWDNNINPTFLSAGSYSYNIIDSIGCTYNQIISIIEPDSFNVNMNITNVICNGQNNGAVSLSVNGGTEPYSYNWFGYDTLNLFAGSYNYTIIDSNNCTYSGIALVNEPNLIDVLNLVIDPSCNNTSDGSVSLQISGGNSPYSVNWGINNPDSLEVGNYEFIVTDINNCTDSNSVTITSESNISVNKTVRDISCRGFCDGSMDLVINGGIVPYSINWFGLDPAFLCEGVVHFEIIDSLGCYYLDSAELIAPDSVGLQINQTGMQLEAIVSGGTAPYQFEWFDNNGSISSNQIIPITNNGYYYCVAIDQNNCQSDTISFLYSDVSTSNLENSIFTIYPNPSENNIIIKFILANKSRLEINLINSLGQRTLIDEYDEFIGTYNKLINISKKSSGVYFINLKTNHNSFNKKLIIK
jgi:hypothetical protein